MPSKKIIYKDLYNKDIKFTNCSIAWFRYNDASTTLFVTFANGKQYSYANVSKIEMNDVLKSQTRLTQLFALIRSKTPVFQQIISAEAIQLGTMRNANYRNLAR